MPGEALGDYGQGKGMGFPMGVYHDVDVAVFFDMEFFVVFGIHEGEGVGRGVHVKLPGDPNGRKARGGRCRYGL